MTNIKLCYIPWQTNYTIYSIVIFAYSLTNIKQIVFYIMAGRALAVANEVFIMETVVFWDCDDG